MWLPNANLREFEIIYKSLKNCFIEPEILFLPVFLDDLRRDSIRKELDSYEYYLCKDLLKRKIMKIYSIGISKLKEILKNLIIK